MVWAPAVRGGVRATRREPLRVHDDVAALINLDCECVGGAWCRTEYAHPRLGVRRAVADATEPARDPFKAEVAAPRQCAFAVRALVAHGEQAVPAFDAKAARYRRVEMHEPEAVIALEMPWRCA